MSIIAAVAIWSLIAAIVIGLCECAPFDPCDNDQDNQCD